MDSTDAAMFWDVSQLTPKERELRDRFVEEYVIDYDRIKAAIRCGYSESFADTYSNKFLTEAYVQQRIQKAELDEASSPEAEADADRRRIRAALLREANYRGPGSSHAARVNALSQLSKIRDMEASKKVDIKTLGGVMVVPGTSDIAGWQQAGMAQQNALQESTLKPLE